MDRQGKKLKRAVSPLPTALGPLLYCESQDFSMPGLTRTLPAGVAAELGTGARHPNGRGGLEPRPMGGPAVAGAQVPDLEVPAAAGAGFTAGRRTGVFAGSLGVARRGARPGPAGAHPDRDDDRA